MRKFDDLEEFLCVSPAGFYLAVRVGFAFPVFEYNELPKKWVERYTTRGLMLSDPLMHWTYQNSGTIRWSDVQIEDPRGVLSQARMFGLNFGALVSCTDSDQPGQRSYGSFARSDREFSNSEISVLQAKVRHLHATKTPPTNLTAAELEALQMVKNGLLMKEIANFLGVTEGAVKQRLKNAKLKLKAKTSTHAATMATSFGLI